MKLLTSTDVAKRAGLWEILEFKFGKNIPSHHDGGVVKFYPHMVDELLIEAGLGGLR